MWKKCGIYAHKVFLKVTLPTTYPFLKNIVWLAIENFAAKRENRQMYILRVYAHCFLHHAKVSTSIKS